MKQIKSLLRKQCCSLVSGFLLVASMPVALVPTPQCHAQSSTSARLSGSVKDPTGSVIPNAKITAFNVGTNLQITVESGTSGNYAFNSLPVGHYTITANRDGFASLTETGVELTVGQ
jgi:hypothetical protein